MPRPCKRRRICALPGALSFGPIGCQTVHDSRDPVAMTLDEYETIRLMDLLGYTQEEAAVSMDVARTTVQAIYENARRKLAQALCESRQLRIEGGNYILCEGRGRGCSCRRCQNEEE